MSALLSSKTVGSIVKLKVNGSFKNFIVVHQGKPSSIYDASCDGTWLLMEDCYESKQWHNSNVNKYESSDIHTYLNGTFLNLFDANIKSAIKQVKLPYRKNGGSGGTTQNGANGLSCKIFLLSGPEVHFTHSYIDTGEGAALKYFENCATTSADTKRVAKLNGSAAGWWLRSPRTYNTNDAWFVYSNGNYSSSNCANSYGVRPALVLPSTLSVSDDGSVQTNSAPTTPSSITVPGSIMGGSSVNISWAASTDPDGDAVNYKVEKSTNGGSTWSQIYQGNATSTTDTVAFGTESVMYRVKAYDTANAESGYKTSSQVTVVNNHAPGAPSSINVPTDVRGGQSLTVTWGASADEDGNLSGYKLERSVDGGAWAEIYVGTALTYSDAITKGWTSVAYRVRGYDPYTTSDYATSPTRTVNNNADPVITCGSSGDLGTKTSGFSVSYSVNDDDPGDTISVTEKLDGVVKRTYNATKGANNSFQVTGDYFQKVLNGNHTMTIEATDGKATVTHTITFAKSVTQAIVTLQQPMEADDVISICAINVAGSIPADAHYTVEVTNNGKDASPVWEDCTTESKAGRNYLFQNHTAANGFAFNFRITARRGSSGVGGYITSIQGGFQ